MILKTEAIVLKSFDFRETSRIATFYSKEYGKVSGVLKGIRKDPRKFQSSLDRFSVNDIVYYPYRNSDLHLISHCDMRRFSPAIRDDLRKATAAQYILELVNKIMPVEAPNPAVYAMMLELLDSLETAADIDQLVHAFQIKMLSMSGFRPHLDACLKCEAPIQGEARFSHHEGGLICARCPMPAGAVQWVSKGSVSSILFVENNDWQSCLRLRLPAPVKKELKFILNNFLIFHLGRKLRSAKYL